MNKTREEVQNEALEAIGDRERSGIGVSMRLGKTLIALRHADKHYSDTLSILVVAPKKSIFKSWEDDIKKFGFDHLVNHIEYCTYLSLNKQTLHYDLLYLDECQSLLYSHESWLRDFKGKILGLTGTPPKLPSSEKGTMISIYCPIVYKYITRDAVDDKILNDYRIFVHMLSLSHQTNIKAGSANRSWYTSEVKTYDYWTRRVDDSTGSKEKMMMTIMRMKALMGFPSKEVLGAKLFLQSNNKCLLFVNTQDQADKLCGYSYHSKNELSEQNLEKFKSGEISKLSCVLQLSEGVTIPGLKEVIILHSYASNHKTMQRIGRCLSLSPEDVSTIHILVYRDTIDQTWTNQALEDLDQNKITYINH